MASSDYVFLPESVRQKIREFWKWKGGESLEHAAKQAFCFYLSHTQAFERDQDEVVNVGIATGILAEQLRNASPDAFIGAFEASILNH
jgi:hypothetical protein